MGLIFCGRLLEGFDTIVRLLPYCFWAKEYYSTTMCEWLLLPDPTSDWLINVPFALTCKGSTKIIGIF